MKSEFCFLFENITKISSYFQNYQVLYFIQSIGQKQNRCRYFKQSNFYTKLDQAQDIKKKPVSMKTHDFSTKSDSKSYTVIKELGQGSFGCVYLVQDERGKKYALKKSRVDPFNFQESERQIEVMKKLSHHNLVKIYDYQIDKEKEIIEILMEYCQEGDLIQYYKKINRTFSVRQILKIFKQIVEAFIAMNVKGVIHRDLKPQNILLTKGLGVKIGDFGCARNVGAYDITKLGDFTLQTGTTIYASPQQLMSEKYSSKCDVWASGVLLFFIYFGYHPFADPIIYKMIQKIKEHTQHKSITLPEETDPTIAKFIQISLIFEDEQRASWRELWLSRIFSQKIDRVKEYVQYLQRLSLIVSNMVKLFWIAKKSFEISDNKDEVFIYFLIRFQYTILLQAKEINQRSKKHRYLFVPQAYAKYNPDKQLVEQTKSDLIDRERFFSYIKESMKKKDASKYIKQTKRVSAFCDLDYTLKYGYKILLEIKSQMAGDMNQEGINFRVWIFMAKWINFQKQFSFQKELKVEQILQDLQAVPDPRKFIEDEIQRYEDGHVI